MKVFNELPEWVKKLVLEEQALQNIAVGFSWEKSRQEREVWYNVYNYNDFSLLEKWAKEKAYQPYLDCLKSSQPNKYKMELSEDLSYSSIVNIVDGDSKKSSDLLESLAFELEETRKKILELSKELKSLKFKEESFISAGKHVARHLKKEMPLSVVRQGFIIVVSESDIVIERNVI